jgi:hypothetical protein
MKTYLLVLGIFVFGQLTLAATSDDKATDRHYTAKTISKDEGLIARAGGVLGFNLSTLSGSGVNTVSMSTKTGLALGALVELGRSSFVIESGLLYRQMGATPTLSGFSLSNIEMDYLGIPILAKFYLNDPEMSTIYLKAGIIPQLLVNNSGWSQFSGPSLTANTFDFELAAGVGGRIIVTDGMGVTIEAAYSQGLTSVASNLTNTMVNSAFTFTAGLNFDLN